MRRFVSLLVIVSLLGMGLPQPAQSLRLSGSDAGRIRAMTSSVRRKAASCLSE